MRRIVGMITLCLIAVMALSGCSILEKMGLKDAQSDEVMPASSIVMGEEEAKKLSDKEPVSLYFANEDNSKLKLEVRYIPSGEAKKSVANRATLIVKELVQGPTKGSGLKATIPAGTVLRSMVSIKDGTATVDFTKALIDKHPGGKAAEQMTIYSIVNSLTEIKEIKDVKFLINGKSQKDFKGSFRFDTAFPRTMSLVSKEVPQIKDDKTRPADKVEPLDQKKDTSSQNITQESNEELAEETYIEILE